MANNNSYKLTPKEIVDGKILFRIPLYQRLFTWGTVEVNQLLEDLRIHFDKQRNKGEEKPYYLGMITVIRQNGRLDLIDGQQRITALNLLSIGFLHCLDAQNWKLFFEDSNRVFFNGRSQDRDFLRKLANNETSLYQNNNMAEGLSCIVSYLKEHFSDVNSLRAFADKVYNSLILFVTELPDHYIETPSSLNEYFEAMNSSGKSLEQHEILKVELLREQSDKDKLIFTRLWNVVSDLTKPIFNTSDDINGRRQVELYLSHIDKVRNKNYDIAFEGIVSEQAASGTGRTTLAEVPVEKFDFGKPDYRDRWDAVISFPQFLLMVLAIHLDNDSIARIHHSHLLATFKDNPLKDVAEFYRQLVYYRLLFDLYIVRIKYSSSSGTHKLIFNSEEEQTGHAHERLKQYESMLEVSTEPHLWILPLLKHISSLDHNPLQLELLRYLTELDKNIHGKECPDVSNMDYGHKPRYWMWRLDYAIWEKLVLYGKESFGYSNIDSEAIRQYEFRENRSIEHLHPQEQSYNDNWESDDINSFGNLAMISNSFNSYQRNKHVHEKFANLEVQINNRNLQSLKLYFMYLSAKRTSEEWTTHAKERHTTEMLNILAESLGQYP